MIVVHTVVASSLSVYQKRLYHDLFYFWNLVEIRTFKWASDKKICFLLRASPIVKALTML